MQRAMGQTGLTLGFYGGIAVVGWFYQILFMPETKNKTLEEIDLIFSMPTGELVALNIRNTMRTWKALLRGRLGHAIALTDTPISNEHDKEDVKV